MTSANKPLNTVLIGIGMVGDTHVNAIAGIKGQVCLKGVYARGQEAAREFAGKASSITGDPCEVYPSIQAIVDDKELDFVILATPANVRMELIDIFTAANLPILLEKPIERTSEAALEIVELCEARNIPLGIVFQHRVRTASVKLKEMIDSGELGTLAMANVEAPLWRSQEYYDEPGRGTYERDGGGVLMTQAIHTLDLMLSLTGDVTDVQAMSRTTAIHQMEAEDFVTAGMTFANGAVGSLLATTANYPGGNECITLHFEKAVAKLDRGELDIFWRDGRTESYGENSEIKDAGDPMAFKSSWHGSVIADFADAITQQRPPMATGRATMKVHRLIDALVASSDQKKTITLSAG